MQIIVADDDLSQRVHMSAMLTRYGFSAVAVADGEAALSALLAGGASVLICDVQMPGMDGMELAQRVRALDLKRYVYVLMVTGLNGSADLMRGLEAGADDFMSKPVDPAVLLSRLRSAARLITYEQRLQTKKSALEAVNRLIQDDLDAAAQAQRMLLPPADLQLNGCRYSSSFVASMSISGDVFGYFDLDRTRSGFFAADVSGHGVRAALSAVAMGYMVSKEFFSAMAISPDDGALRPERVAQVLDQRFGAKLNDDSYFTHIRHHNLPPAQGLTMLGRPLSGRPLGGRPLDARRLGNPPCSA